MLFVVRYHIKIKREVGSRMEVNELGNVLHNALFGITKQQLQSIHLLLTGSYILPAVLPYTRIPNIPPNIQWSTVKSWELARYFINFFRPFIISLEKRLRLCLMEQKVCSSHAWKLNTTATISRKLLEITSEKKCCRLFIL